MLKVLPSGRSRILVTASTTCYNGGRHLIHRLRKYSSIEKPSPIKNRNIQSGLSLTDLDKKWRAKWKNHPPRPLDDGDGSSGKEKYFALSMFPYPSGILHIGHLRVYTISDVLARYRRMNDYDVIHAMGWDAFGLPAENAAIERNIDPAVWTYDNIEKMKDQMDTMLADFDWDREVITCSPDYYKWTQKLFLMLFEAGFAYRKEAVVNWDPIEKTVLANEQVDSDGRSWRSGALVEKKKLEQWFLSITKLGSELVDDLKILDDWPKKVKVMQTNWIGRSRGAQVNFPIRYKGEQQLNSEIIESFTTRPDTLFGVEYVALSLDHPIVSTLAPKNSQLDQFVHEARNLPEISINESKIGFQIPGLYVANPLEPEIFNIPVFVAPYVISDYGHGAVMGCPAHDSRDYEFWQKNYTIPTSATGAKFRTVINPPDDVKLSPGEIYTGKNGTLNENCGKFVGLSSDKGGKAIIEDLSKNGGLVKEATQLRLRDWLISRQRFWGAPIPIIHCDNCGIVPVPDEDLPVLLPQNLGGTPLASSKEFIDTKCPSCGDNHAHRDTDTMDTFMDSAWYFFRYTDPKNEQNIFNYEKASNLMPVDIYIGGVEHAILHLLYTRFISKFLAKTGAWSGGDLNGEPIRRLVTQGMVHGRTLIDSDSGRFLKPDEVDDLASYQPIVKETGKPAEISYEKMSKSKFNGADPVQCIKTHGADATRAHILFQAPVSDVLNWDEKKIVGIERWLGRVESIVNEMVRRLDNATDLNIDESNLSNEAITLWNEVQTKINQITTAFHDDLSMNTVISDYMKLTRTIITALDSNVGIPTLLYSVKTLLKLMAPVTPANAEEGWEKLLNAEGRPWTTIFADKWPQLNPLKELRKSTTIPTHYNVFINNKRVLEISLPEDSTNIGDDDLINLVKLNGGQKLLDGKIIKKVIRPIGKSIIIINTQ